MAKQQPIKKSSDTTKVQPRYVVTPSDKKKMAQVNSYGSTSSLNKSDTTKLKNQANVRSDQSLQKRNAERVMLEKKKPLPKPTPTLTAKDLPKKK